MIRKIVPLVFCFILLQQATARKSYPVPTVEKAVSPDDTISFLHITDLHTIFEQESYNPDFLASRKQRQYDKSEIRLRHFLQTIPQKTGSDLVIATGDLVDFFEADVTDSRKLEAQTKNFARLLKDYKVPVLCTVGNHDYFSFNWTNNKLEHNQNSSVRARAYWTRNLSCFRNGTSYSRVYKAGQTTYRLIFLDDAFYQFIPAEKNEVPYIDKAQLYWLRDQIQESQDDVEIILMHIPFEDSQAQSEYANDLYSVLTQNNSVKLILSGHYHKNKVSVFPSENNKTMIQVQTGTLSQNAGNWRQIHLTEKNILVSVPGKCENELLISIK